MTDLVMLEASLFHLRTALASVADDFLTSQLELTTSVLTNAVAAAHGSLNAARMNDIEFALNDVAAVVDSLSAADAAQVIPALDLFRADVEALKAATALPPDVLDALRAFRSKLNARRGVIERQTMVENAPPLPPAEQLAPDARALQTRLAASGFETPALTAFVEDPAALRFHLIGEIIDELDTIA